MKALIEVAGKKVTLFSPLSGHVFNPLTFEMGRTGGSARNLARYHDDLNQVLTRSSGDSGEKFWKVYEAETLEAAFELVYGVLGEDATYATVHDVIMGIPLDVEHGKSAAFGETVCGKLLNTAMTRGMDVRSIADLFLKKIPSVGEKARGAIVAQAAASVAPFTHGPIVNAVNGRTTLSPEQMLSGHTVLDFDTLTYGVPGLAFQLIVSWFLQGATLRRTGDFPYFCLYRDEYHEFSHARDIQAQSLGRSQRYIGISMFQTFPVLKAAFGGGVEAETQAQAVYGLHVNKVMVNNNCRETNELNAEILGRHKDMFFSGGGRVHQEQGAWYDVLGVGNAPTVNFSQQWHYLFPPTDFQRLRTGGPRNHFLVDAVVTRGDDNFFLHTFSQR
ncbi:MAG: hypothetical protein AAFX06_14150 [Planctomycetota bacterium]